jgi:deoxyguanosine kinase
MIIVVEGCIGVGKSTLVRLCTQALNCYPLYEEVERNPFLTDFYHARDRASVAMHVQYTFLFLQEWQFRDAVTASEQGHLVICDFHPLKSIVFSQVVLPPSERAPLARLYETLHVPQPDLIVYLRADRHTILSRVRKRGDVYMDDIDLTYVTQVASSYDAFFESYKGRFVTIDNSRLDYYERQDIQVPLQHMQVGIDILSYLKPQKAIQNQQSE